MHLVYFLDLCGTFAFAVFGAYLAQKKGYDIFGITVCAMLSALGGGTVRELILNQVPFYFFDYSYFYVILLAILFSLIAYKQIKKINSFMLGIDALGLATFAFIGAARADQFQLGVLGVICLAVISAVGGGLIRDISMRETPLILYKDFYATPAVIMGVLYWLFRGNMQSELAVYGIIFIVFAVRILAIKFNIQLWKPYNLKH